MSPRNWILRIHDILDAINDIESFVSGITYKNFKEDKKTYLAVIRCLEVIGEAANHVPSTVMSEHPEIPWRKIKDFRNVLVHQYFGVDNEIVWKTVHDELLPLKVALKKIKA